MKKQMDDKLKRVISAAILVPIVVALIVLGDIAFKIFISLITLIAIFEYRNAYNVTINKVITGVLLIGFVLNTYMIFAKSNVYETPILILIVLLSLASPVFNRRYDVTSIGVTITGFVYIIKFFGYLVDIRDMDHGINYIWLVFIIAWFCDTFAYYAGRFFGKHKLCPEISPKKTKEGAVGGVLGSVVGVVAWNIINIGLSIPFYKIVILGVIGGIISQVGDLTASLIKRYSGVKDYGKIMPGHGGILDRFDSILYTTPVVYYYIVFIIG